MQTVKVRVALEKKIRRPVSEAMWDYLTDRGFVDDVVFGAKDTDYLVQEVNRIELAAAPPPSTFVEMARPEGPARGQDRKWALSQLVAVQMSKHDRVRTFRAKHLGDSLIDWADVGVWLKSQTTLDGPRTTDLTVTIPHEQLVYKPGAVGRLDPPLEQLGNGFSVKFEVLDYALPGDGWVSRLGVSARGVLDQLRRLSVWLADNCGWQPAQGTIFILTGVTPLIPAVRATTTLVSSRPGWANRIQLDIDPAATVDEVVALLHEVRQEQGLTRRRTIAPKLARLAAFTMAEHVDKPWKIRQRLWNESFENWQYEHGTNFRRDAIKAMKRLMDT